jgi:hypothetical protein
MRQKELGVSFFGITIPGFTLDSIMIMIARRLIEELADSTIEWINTGFEGSPTFAVDPGQYFQDVGDRVAGQFITDLGLGGLCSPFRLNIQNSLTTSYKENRNQEISCTISDVVNNVEGFLDGDFVSGGWEGLRHLALNPTSNPYGALLQAEQELNIELENALLQEELQLNWGAGFLSTRECIKYGELPPELLGNANSEAPCLEYGPTKTPGTLIEGQVQKVFGSEVDQLNLADEFDEILSALVDQLVNTVFNEAGVFDNDGLANRNVKGGASRPRLGACFPNKNTAIADEDEVTWTFAGVDENTTVVWSGDGGLSGTGPTVNITYPSSGRMGTQSAQVVVTRTTKIEGEADIVKTETLPCGATVDVSPYPPLEVVECKVDPFVLRGFGNTARWTVKIIGGSGQLGDVILNTEDIIHVDGARRDVLTTLPPTFQDGIFTFEYIVMYNLGGTRGFSFTLISDIDPYVRPVNGYQCSDKVQVIPG